MSAFITNGSEYNGQETEDIILRPLFIGETPQEMGVRVVFTQKAASIKLTFFDLMTKILMPYASGWQGGAAATKRQKKFSLAEFKAEQAYDKHDYSSTILWEITNNQGVKQNDISGTNVMQAEVQVFQNALQYDIWRIFWMGDTTKVHLATGTYPDGTTSYAIGAENKYYSTIDGIWKGIMDNYAAYGSATLQQIRRITISNGAVAQSIIYTLSGTTAGTITLTINGYAFSQAYASSVAATCTAWLATHTALLTKMKITVTDDLSAGLTIASSIAGKAYTIVATSAGTNGTWTPSSSTANTTPSALTTDEAMATLKSVYNNSTDQLKAMKKTGRLVYYCTQSVIDNYHDSIVDDGTEQGHTKLVDGIERYTYNGIPLIPMAIDQIITDDFTNEYPHRVILTVPDNMVLVLSQADGFAETRFWFNPDENENRQRCQFEFGADYFLPELMTVAF